MNAARLAVAALLSALVLFGIRAFRVAAMDGYLETRSYEAIYYLPPPTWLEAFSLGHRRALADLIWMKGLVYVGDEFRESGGMDNVFRYADAMITLDPDFRRAYAWTGVAGLYRPVETTREDVDRTLEFLRAGVARFPNDGEMHWDLGTTIQYELVRLLEGEERDAAEAEATRHMTIALRFGAGPTYIALTNATRLIRQGELSAAIRHLEEVYPLVDDDVLREDIRARLTALRGEAAAESVSLDRREFEERWRADYPWLPASFYAIVGRRPVVPRGRFPEELRFEP
ncbi:MAG: hypothetical protein AAF411_25085 [Myxococcota bacterium]